MSIALNLQGFPEYFDFTRRVATNKAKITCKSLYLQHSDHSRYDSTDLFRFNECWHLILNKAMEKFDLNSDKQRQVTLSAPA